MFLALNILGDNDRYMYTYSLVVGGTALLFNPRQELLPEGLLQGTFFCEVWVKDKKRTHRRIYFFKYLQIFSYYPLSL